MQRAAGRIPTAPGTFQNRIRPIKEVPTRRSGRVVECTGLENRRARKRTVGSNPTSSATYLSEIALPIRLPPDFSIVFESYAGGAVHHARRETPEIGLSGPIFSGPHDCAVLVNSF